MDIVAKHTYSKQGLYGNALSVENWAMMDSLEEELRKVNEYDFDFENLVFEGGGMKMGAYIGVVKVWINLPFIVFYAF